MKAQKKILIVEDEVIVAMFLREELEQMGLSVCRLASNSEAALEIMRKEKPDIVIMDIGLPRGRDGIETTMIIKKENPGLPVIYLTGYDDNHMRTRAMATEPLGFVAKPADIGLITEIIEDHFNARE